MAELLNFGVGELVAAATVLFLASIVLGYSGFGFSAVLVLAMSALRVPPAHMRGTLIAYFFLSDIYAVSLFLWRGELDSVYSWRIAASIPLMIAGVLIGSKAFFGTSVETFRRSTLMLLLVIAAVGLVRLSFA